ncbi:sodium/proline symporter PutP [Neisseria shayeganii]|uniref:Sodium/proline symporter n=1 Tax=Neisseria shayeganii 871 TaxID=1032488 RepID=G4CFS9_9NEIS|nr:sodium/proline symporter PutP [Neisseria shayeganii]EGY53345.1 SSS family proline:sodium (Na+) symporter [Neisseria shayeganii 871]
MNNLYFSFGLYFLGMLAVGIYFYLKTKNASDYILGSRNLPPSVAALSAGASDLSGWALMGLPGAIYAGGFGNIWIIFFTLAGVYLNWKLIAPRLRLLTEALNDAKTIPEYLSNRFGNNILLKTVSAAVTLFFFTLYVVAGLSGGAVVFEKTFGIDYDTALLVGSVAIISYTFLGGYLAVSWTDFFQGLMMAASMLVVALMLFFLFGGVSGTYQAAELHRITLDNLKPQMGWLLGLISLSGWCIGYLGQPHVLVRFMSVRRVEDIKVSRRIAMIWSTVTMLSALAVGFLGAAYFKEAPLPNSETVLIALSQALFHPFVAGLVIAGILAAIMSTIDSQLLVCSTTFSEDIYRTYFRKNASDREILNVSRIAVLVLACMGIYMAYSQKDSTLLSMVAYAWGGFGAAFGPVILLSLFWKRMTGTAAIAGMVTGAVVVVAWKQQTGGIFEVFEVVPGFTAATLAVVAVSLCGKAPELPVALNAAQIPTQPKTTQPKNG